MKKILITSVAALALSTGAAFAQTAPAAPASGDASMTPDTTLAAADTDASGGVSLAEAQVIWTGLTQDAFTGADTNADGQLDETEYAALVASSAGAATSAPDDESQSETEESDDDSTNPAPATPQ